MGEPPKAAAESPGRRPRRDLVAVAVLAAGCAAILVWLSARQAWVTDDALIAFRYVDNLIAGRGLTFNAGERIEAFSSPLLVGLLAPLRAAGANLFTATEWLGVLCTLAELGLLMGLLWRESGRSPLSAGVAGLLYCTDRIVFVWATGGLETSLYSMLLCGSFALSVLARRREPAAGPARAGVVHVLLATARPEGIAYYPLHLLALVSGGWRDGSWRRAVGRSLLCTLPAVGALVLLRYAYYGALLPNAYYAKLSGVPVAEIGLGYVRYFAARMGWLSASHLLAWAVVVGLCSWAWQAEEGATPARRGLRQIVIVGSAYVAWSLLLVALEGGDYMTDFRLLRPVMGILYAVLGAALGLALTARAGWLRRAAPVGIAALLISHGLRQGEPTPMFGDAPEPERHKAILTVTEQQAEQFRAALQRMAEPGDSLMTDWSGFMGLGHSYRTIDCTGLTSARIEEGFYLRPEWSRAHRRERLPGHARWPKIDFMTDNEITFIFPKISRKPPQEAEVHRKSMARYKRYPYLHASLGLGDGRYFRFFTRLSADALAERAARQGLDLCWRPPQGDLYCAGQPLDEGHAHRQPAEADLPPGLIWQGPRTPPQSPKEALMQFFTAMNAEDCEWVRSVSTGRQAELLRLSTCGQLKQGYDELRPIRLLSVGQTRPDGRAKHQLLVNVRYYGKGKERHSTLKLEPAGGVWKVARF